MKKVNIKNDSALCPECNLESGCDDRGYYCENCDIVFNTCSNCDDGTLLFLKGWGCNCGIHFSCEKHDVCDCSPKQFTYTHNDDKNPKYFALRTDEEAIEDNTGYQWYCPKCEETTESHAD